MTLEICKFIRRAILMNHDLRRCCAERQRFQHKARFAGLLVYGDFATVKSFGLFCSTPSHVSLAYTFLKIMVPFVRTFSDVPVNRPLLYIDSRGHVELAVNQGSLAATYGIKPPGPIFIPRLKN